MNTVFIGNRIAKLREVKNISARTMSLELGQSQSYINKIENHISQPSIEMFLEICDFLDVTPAEFFDESTESPLLIKDLIDQAKCLDKASLRELTSFVMMINKRS